jgi:CubicO group peptidase (beta-lactamase class C family)
MNLALRLLVIWLLIALSGASGFASSHACVDEQKLSEIPKRMQQFVEDNTISGAVTLVARHGEIVALDAVGLADIAAKRAMREDSLFWIASMTKPITATAVLILHEEGKLSIDDPVEKYLPEFKNQWLIDNRGSNTLTLKRPQRAITIRDLLTHTSGLGDVSAPRPNSTLAELVMAYSQAPLKFEPGSRWEYCNSGMNTLGRIVEVVSGKGFEQFLEQRIFRPVGMKDTTFHPSQSQARRLAKTYQPGPNSGLQETNIWFIKSNLSDRTRTVFPSGGLFSTASDVFRFYQMVLNGGTAGKESRSNGKRIVSRDSIELMTRTQTGALRTGFTDGMSFGLGFAVVREPAGVTAMLSRGSFGHGGAYGTQVWVDPQRDMVFVLMIQRARLSNADASPIRKAFQELAVAAIEE